ncbi:hypothetical protein Daura_12205 [Dactylosporangium aurantiacum]|uniref:PLL-like beta propeller domain-containing protein n=1 Tax=Dactylosporangium aurantiacum TaxID=35754 RepID=A0A9Q9IIR7_9ACTN|nr:hypothetical protein [Dactylosporangium aurantiacum]MDG6104124.1 hypothetical protein [Dactylosporangium aurantiacum]UWZ56867.1 hypothetical protein Daura_12205 [Dactylosporangium aurantiacum]
MTTRHRLARRFTTLVLTPVVGLAGAVVTDLAVGTAPAHAASTYSATITRSEVMSRVRDWYGRRDDADMTYSSTDTAKDVDGDHRYRTDCSGYVAMAWHSDKQPSTYELQDSTDSRAVPISKSQLQPGDILVDNVGDEHHAVIFQGWNDVSKTSFQYYSFGSTPIVHYTDGGFGADDRISGKLASHYNAYRYERIADATPGVGAVQIGTTTRVFFRGADGALWQYYLEGGHWTSQKIGGQIIGNPSAVYDPNENLIRVFVQGTDRALWQFYWNGSSWQQQRIGGSLSSGTGAVVKGNVVRVFYRGGDGSLWQHYLSGGSWASQRIGGLMLDNPAVVDDAAYLRVLFQGTDGAMWQYYWDGGSWRQQRIGGEFTSGFGVLWLGGVVRVFARGAGHGSLYQYYLADGTWTLQSLGGEITSNAGATFDGYLLRVFARGADGALWQNVWDGSTWNWSKIGGKLA